MSSSFKSSDHQAVRLDSRVTLAGMLSRKCILALIWTSLVVAAVGTSLRAAAKPNIVFFLVDDMRWQETSVAFHTEVTALIRWRARRRSTSWLAKECFTSGASPNRFARRRASR